MRTFKVLLVEDCSTDQFTAQEALTSYWENVEVTIANDGFDAIQYLSGGYVPDFILLDMNMPRMGGNEFLEYYKEHALYHRPVFIISSKTGIEDSILSAYPFVKQCLQKPLDEYALDAIRY